MVDYCYDHPVRGDLDALHPHPWAFGQTAEVCLAPENRET